MLASQGGSLLGSQLARMALAGVSTGLLSRLGRQLHSTVGAPSVHAVAEAAEKFAENAGKATVEVNGQAITVPEGVSILEACSKLGIYVSRRRPPAAAQRSASPPRAVSHGPVPPSRARAGAHALHAPAAAHDARHLQAVPGRGGRQAQGPAGRRPPARRCERARTGGWGWGGGAPCGRPADKRA